MKSLKITLLLAALTAVFVLTVSGVSKEDKINTNAIEKIDKSEHQITGPTKKKNKLPGQNS